MKVEEGPMTPVGVQILFKRDDIEVTYIINAEEGIWRNTVPKGNLYWYTNQFPQILGKFRKRTVNFLPRGGITANPLNTFAKRLAR